MESPLPPGQTVADLARFGLPAFAPRWPVVPDPVVLTVGGEVRSPRQVAFAALAASLPRREQRSDLHCVTTWTALDLAWSGLAAGDVIGELVRLVRPHPAVRWVHLRGLDGFGACLLLEDAVAGDVLLADRMGGEPLPVEHGAPLRLVAPAHYGYKSVKHLCAIEFRRRYRAGPAGWMEHPRARVATEERSRALPGRWYRPLWRTLVPTVRRAHDRAGRRRAAPQLPTEGSGR